jgi:uncharacterized protein YndB with AHSA1/START domain
MLEVSAERRFDVSTDELWPWVDKPEWFARWFSFAERVELLEGNGVGSRRRQHGHWGKKASEVDQRITEHVPGERLSWEHEAERLDGKPAPKFARSTNFTIALVPDGTGTILRMTSNQEPAGAMRGLVMRAFGTKELKTGLEKSLKDLAQLIGRRPPG